MDPPPANDDAPPPFDKDAPRFDPGAPRDALDRLQDALERSTVFPSTYVFKFIVPQAEVSHLLALLDPLPTQLRPSASGRYVSVTVETRVRSSDEVILVYRRTQVVKGIRAF